MTFGRLYRGYTQSVKRPQTRSRLYAGGGSDEYLKYSSPVLSTTPMTMAAWFKTDNVTNNGTLLSIADEATNSHFFVLQNAGGAGGDPIRIAINDGGGQQNANTTTGYAAGTWHHACGVLASPTDRAVFIDADSKGTSVGASTPAGLDNTTVGALEFAAGAVSDMDGAIFLPALWCAALTDSEVWQLAQGALPWRVRPQSLVACWDEFGRNLVNNRFQMTPVNAPGFAGGAPRIRNEWILPYGKSPIVARVPRHPVHHFQIPAMV